MAKAHEIGTSSIKVYFAWHIIVVPRKRKEIIGSAKNLPIRAAKPMLRVADVFVSRLDPQLIACDLQNFLVGKLHIEVDVELVKVTEHLSSFHVYSQCSQPNVFI